MAMSGSCLCGGVRYEITGELSDVYNCHCSMCRKLHAAAFRTSCKIRSADWTTQQGEQLIRFYESSPGEHKAFCSVCSSSLFTRFDAQPDFYGSPWVRCIPTRVFAPSGMYLLPTRRPGSRSPMICPGTMSSASEMVNRSRKGYPLS